MEKASVQIRGRSSYVRVTLIPTLDMFAPITNTWPRFGMDDIIVVRAIVPLSQGEVMEVILDLAVPHQQPWWVRRDVALQKKLIPTIPRFPHKATVVEVVTAKGAAAIEGKRGSEEGLRSVVDGRLTMTGAMKLQPDDGPRSSVSIGSGFVRCSEISPEFVRRFIEGIGKLAENMLGDCKKKTIGLAARIPEAVGLAGVRS
ncbi:hypothetical protein B296_00009249 [Ensete ventricosum]|uniref:Uncharacterized protein n=1 Tax=Ensete ventricosum TaxID=4639 RepID=A0A426YUH3_ENSVE|nr:hypothetical protein B296_00009249 [Ensete ventricosum]